MCKCRGAGAGLPVPGKSNTLKHTEQLVSEVTLFDFSLPSEIFVLIDVLSLSTVPSFNVDILHSMLSEEESNSRFSGGVMTIDGIVADDIEKLLVV